MRALILIMIIFGVIFVLVGLPMLIWGNFVGGFNDWIKTGIPIFFIGLLLLAGSVVLSRKPKKEAMEEENDSMEILKQRYAKGEISKEEFENMKKDLENS